MLIRKRKIFCSNSCKNNSKHVRFFLNEWPIGYAGCDNETGLCPLGYIQKKFKQFIDRHTCNLDFCEDTAENTVSSEPSSFSISNLTLKWFAITALTLIFLYLLIFRILKLKCIGDCRRKSNQYTQLD